MLISKILPLIDRKKILEQNRCTSRFLERTWFTQKQHSGWLQVQIRAYQQIFARELIRQCVRIQLTTTSFIWLLWQQPLSHYQMSDMFKMAGDSSLASFSEKQSSGVTVVLCLEWEPVHSFLSTAQQAGRGGCWGEQQVSDRETVHCALWDLDWGYPLNNCSGCWNWFKVFRHISDHASHPSPSYRRLQAVNNRIYWPQDHSSCLVKM